MQKEIDIQYCIQMDVQLRNRVFKKKHKQYKAKKKKIIVKFIMIIIFILTYNGKRIIN